MEKSLFSVCVYILEMLIAFAFFSRNYKRKKSVFLVMTIGVLLFVPCSFIFTIFNNEIINLTVFFLINLLFGVICFDIKIKSSVIQSILLDALMFATELFTIFIYSTIAHTNTSLYKTNFTVFIIVTIVSKILYLTVSQLLAFMVKKENPELFRNKYFFPLFIFPVLTIVTCTIFLFIALDVELSVEYQIAIFVVSALFVLSAIFMFVYYQTLAEKESRINELEAERIINSINSAYLDVLEHQNEDFQMIFHDTKHHYMTLRDMKNIDDVKKYINKLFPSFEKMNKVRVSGNRIIDLILNKYMVICENSDINFSYEVRTADLSYIDDVELSIILNNALDNAVEAARDSAEKNVEISLRHINNMDLLSIINSCDTEPVFKGTRLISTKRNYEKHGFGSRIIEYHTKNNNGNYNWFYDEKEKKFHLTLIFQPSNIR